MFGSAHDGNAPSRDPYGADGLISRSTERLAGADVVTVNVSGDLGASRSNDLSVALDLARLSRAGGCILDLSRVGSLHSAVLGTLRQSARRLESAGIGFALVVPLDGASYRALRSTRLLNELQVYRARAEAVRALTHGSPNGVAGRNGGFRRNSMTDRFSFPD